VFVSGRRYYRCPFTGYYNLHTYTHAYCKCRDLLHIMLCSVVFMVWRFSDGLLHDVIIISTHTLTRDYGRPPSTIIYYYYRSEQTVNLHPVFLIVIYTPHTRTHFGYSLIYAYVADVVRGWSRTVGSGCARASFVKSKLLELGRYVTSRNVGNLIISIETYKSVWCTLYYIYIIL